MPATEPPAGDGGASSAALRIGLIGGGRHATANLHPALALAGGRVAAVATRREDGAAALAARVGAPRWHGSYRSMLDAGGLDAVVVSIDPADQAAVTEDCLRAGVDVFVEKPLGLTSAEAARVADVADECDRLVMVGFMKRFAPCYSVVRDVMAAEGFGTPFGLDATFAFAPWTPDLRTETFLLFAAIHVVDLVRDLAGEVTDAAGFRRADGADVTLAYALRTAGGMVGTVTLASLAGWARAHERVTVHGTHGFVTAEDLDTVRYHLDRRRPEEPPRWQHLDEDTVVLTPASSTGSGGHGDLYRRGFVGELAHFLDCVVTRRQPRTSARDNVATMVLCERLLAC